MSRLESVACPLYPYDGSVGGSAASLTAERRAAPPSPPRVRAAIDMTQSRLWVPLYVTVLVALVVNIVLMVVSMSVNMVEVPIVPPSWPVVGYPAVSDTCPGGCAAVNVAAINGRLTELARGTEVEDKTDAALYPQKRESWDVIEQMAPFNITWCEENLDNDGVWLYGFVNFTMKSLTGNASVRFTVYCSIGSTYEVYSGSYDVGALFYHARGAPRILRTSQYLLKKTPIMYALLFAFGGLSLVVHIAAFALRAQMRGRRTGSDDGDERCCPCNPPHHVRRLLIVVIAFVAANVVVTVVQFVVCNKVSVEHANKVRYPDVDYTMLGVYSGYYGILAVILVVELCALVCACVMYAKRV